MKGKVISPNKLINKYSITRATPSTNSSHSIIPSNFARSPKISQKTFKKATVRLLKKQEQLETKQIDSNPTLKVKLQTSNSPKNSPGRTWKIQRVSIQPLREISPGSSINNYYLTIDQKAIHRPYQANKKEEESKEVSLLTKMIYWRKKKVEQYKAAKNISHVLKTENGLVSKIRESLTPTLDSTTIFEEPFIRHEKQKRRFTVKEICSKGLRQDLTDRSPCSTNETLTPK